MKNPKERSEASKLLKKKMIYNSQYIVYPEGDVQEINHHLSINQITDINGFPLNLPLPTPKMIAYRVYKIQTKELRGEERTLFFLELLRINELEELAR